MAFATDINEIPTEFLVCRVFGHRWNEGAIIDRVTGRAKDKTILTFDRWMVCARCALERVDDMLWSSFEPQRTTYTYPDMYLVKGRQIRRADARRELFNRKHWRLR